MKKSTDVIAIYHKEYFLEAVDGYKEFKDFDGTSECILDRYKRNINFINLSKNEKILEFGCGRGELVLFYRKQGFDSIGVDYSKEAIALAVQKQNDLSIEGELFYCSSFENVQFKDESFDVIYASEFIEHISKHEFDQFLDICIKLLKPGGRVVFFTYPNTLLRKYGYPLIRLFKLVCKFQTTSKLMDDQLSEHYKEYHLNEQNFFVLRRQLMGYHFTDINIFYDVDYTRFGIFKNLIGNTFLRHLFSSNLIAIAKKPQ